MTIAVYAGTFDPVTAGHLSVVREAARLFTHLVVVVAVNPEKRTLLTADERLELLRRATAHHPNVRCAATGGWVVHYAREIGAGALVRGIRGATDVEYETTLARLNRQAAPEISTVFVPAEQQLAEVSSSALKEKLLRGEDVSAFCSPEIAARVRERLGVPDTQSEGAR